MQHYGLVLYSIGGNHEDYAQVQQFEQHPDPDGFVTLRPGVRWIPRGLRWVWDDVRFGAIGGAFSLDGGKPNIYWWPDQEQVQMSDLYRLGDSPLDVLVTHDIPIGVDMGVLPLPECLQIQTDKSRHLLQAAVEATHPRLLVHGHWHKRRSNRLVLDDGWEVQVEGYASDTQGDERSWGVLELPDMHLAPVAS